MGEQYIHDWKAKLRAAVTVLEEVVLQRFNEASHHERVRDLSGNVQLVSSYKNEQLPKWWILWCRGTESNCRHQPFQGCALPTELPRHSGRILERGSCLQDHRQKINSSSWTWRRGRDLNPRQAFDLCRFSKPVPSATRPPLRKPQTVCGSLAPRRKRLGSFHAKKGDHTPEHGSHSSNSRMILRSVSGRWGKGEDACCYRFPNSLRISMKVVCH